MQLDESTDVFNMSQLTVLFKFYFKNEIHELLFCESLKERCTGGDKFSTVNDIFNKKQCFMVKLCSITADGTTALTGILKKKGFWDMVANIAPHMKLILCLVHRQAIAAKLLEPEEHKVLHNVINMVNFIKTRPVNSRIFTILVMRWGVTMEIFCTAQRFTGYLTANCLKELSNLKMSCAFFFYKKTCSNFADLSCDDKWLPLACYLADI